MYPRLIMIFLSLILATGFGSVVSDVNDISDDDVALFNDISDDDVALFNEMNQTLFNVFKDLKADNDSVRRSFIDLGAAFDALASFYREGINLDPLTVSQQENLGSCLMLIAYDVSFNMSFNMSLLNASDDELRKNKDFLELALYSLKLKDIKYDAAKQSISNIFISENQYHLICLKCASVAKVLYERLMCGYDIDTDMASWSWKQSSLTESQKETLQSIYPNASDICKTMKRPNNTMSN